VVDSFRAITRLIINSYLEPNKPLPELLQTAHGELSIVGSGIVELPTANYDALSGNKRS
jgi:hypothetical protein